MCIFSNSFYKEIFYLIFSIYVTFNANKTREKKNYVIHLYIHTNMYVCIYTYTYIRTYAYVWICGCVFQYQVQRNCMRVLKLVSKLVTGGSSY